MPAFRPSQGHALLRRLGGSRHGLSALLGHVVKRTLRCSLDGHRVVKFGRRDRRQIARQRTSAISRSHAVLISDFVAGVGRPPAYPTARAICGSIVEGQMVSLV